jgi:hypothetical protein
MLNVYVTKRDVEILKFINDMKFSNVGQVHGMFFRGKGKQYLQRRLKKFSDEGILLRYPDWGGRSFNYGVSEDGVNLILRHGQNTVPLNLKRIDIKNFEHDKILTELRIELESLGLVSHWKSERLIRYEEDFLKFGLEKRIIADGYAFSVKKEDRVVIEFEHSRKSNQRIKELLNNYENYFKEKGSSEFGRVLFFFSDSNIKSYYERIFSNMNYTFPVEFFELSELKIDVNKIMGGRYVQ